MAERACEGGGGSDLSPQHAGPSGTPTLAQSASQRRAATPVGTSAPSPALPRRGGGRGPQFGVVVDAFRHTALLPLDSGAASSALVEHSQRRRPETHDLSREAVRTALRAQRVARQQLAELQRRDDAPSLVRLYAASIRPPHTPPALLSAVSCGSRARVSNRSPERSGVPAKRRAASALGTHLAVIDADISCAEGDAQLIDDLGAARLREQRPNGGFAGRTIDQRPDLMTPLKYFCQELQERQRAISGTDKPLLRDRPLSPFRCAASHSDPGRVYPPPGLQSVLRACSRRDDRSPMHHVRSLQHPLDAGPALRTRRDDARARREVAIKSVLERRVATPQHWRQLDTRDGGGCGVPPTKTTERVRHRAATVRQHLIRKNMNSTGDTMAESSVRPPSQSFSAHHSSSSAQQHGGSGCDVNMLALHRGGIVKRMYNV